MHQLNKLAAAAAFALLTINLAHAADKTPDATFDLSGGSISVGVGYAWGKGTLHYNGNDYPFSVSRLTVLDIVAEKISATGEVYSLGNLQDFSGSYSGVAAGAALVYGGSTGVMEN